MKRTLHALALTLAAAQIAGGCASRPEPAPAAPARSAEAPAPLPETVFAAGDSWAGEGRALQDVTIRIDVADSKERILADDGTGFLVIREEPSPANGSKIGPAARLTYRDAEPSSYRMPGGIYSLQALGADHPCDPSEFHVPADPPEGAEVRIDIDIAVSGDLAKVTLSHPGAWGAGVANQRSIRWCGHGRHVAPDKPMSVAGGVALGAVGGTLYGAGAGLLSCLGTGPAAVFCAAIMVPVGAGTGLAVGGVAGGVVADKQQKAAAGLGDGKTVPLPVAPSGADAPASPDGKAEAQSAPGSGAKQPPETVTVNRRSATPHECKDLAVGGPPNPWTNLACERAGY